MVDYAAEAEWIVRFESPFHFNPRPRTSKVYPPPSLLAPSSNRWKISTDTTYVVIPSTSMYQARCNCPLPWGGPSCGTQLGCLAGNSSSAVFSGALSGTTVAGTCFPGMFSAGPLRTCTGTVWGPVTNPCFGYLSFFTSIHLSSVSLLPALPSLLFDFLTIPLSVSSTFQFGSFFIKKPFFTISTELR